MRTAPRESMHICPDRISAPRGNRADSFKATRPRWHETPGHTRRARPKQSHSTGVPPRSDSRSQPDGTLPRQSRDVAPSVTGRVTETSPARLRAR